MPGDDRGMRITNQWRAEIHAFLDAEAAAGHPATTRYTRRQHLQHLARRVPLPPWSVSADDLAHYAATQRWARDTRRARRATFVAFWAWAIATGRTSYDPTLVLPKMKAQEPDPRPAPDPVYLAALARADHDERLWIDLAAQHGLRRAEIAQIQCEDLIQADEGTDLVVHGKGGKPRTIPLTDDMATALWQLTHQRKSGPLWPGDDAGHISPRWLGKRVNRLLDGRWTIHKLRHRAATRFWVSSNGDPYAVAELMGWSNLNMVTRYVHQPTARLRRILTTASRLTDPNP